ncbi:MAG: hypothetical protein R6X35_07600 [Candidatus Krumholzibacteriia bacterium]
MKSFAKYGLLAGVALLLVGGSALATTDPGGAVIIPRVFNDSFASILTTDNSYPSYININDVAAGPLGWANLHVWRMSDDATTPFEFNNTDGFRIAADLTISGDGKAEAGLQISPWWSPLVDGRFNVRTTDGEVACFGGRLPFYSFGAGQYTMGQTVRVEMIYRPNVEMNEAMPATIEYIFGGTSSGELPFDEGNPAEAELHGTWGILTPATVGGHFQFFDMATDGDGTSMTVNWGNIVFEDLGSVVPTEEQSWSGVKALFR